jgi:MerR family transcriptional regulator/heat shock protein HspR
MRMRVAIRRREGQLSNGTIKIGAVARHFGISVDLLRLYEREGLLIPLKSPRGTRYFTEHDYLWIGTILRLVREARLNFAGIRRLLALLPCWEIRQCGYERRMGCKVIQDSSRPCWSNRACLKSSAPCPEKPGEVLSLREGLKAQQKFAEPFADCYFCSVYRSAPHCENLKILLAATPESVKPPGQSFE